MINRSSGEAAAASVGGGWATLRQHIKKKKKIQQRRCPGICCHFLCRTAAAYPTARPPPRLPGEEGEGVTGWARWRIFQMFASGNLSPLVAFKGEGKALGK